MLDESAASKGPWPALPFTGVYAGVEEMRATEARRGSWKDESGTEQFALGLTLGDAHVL